MGRYSVGQRVRDPDGDLCEIIGKPARGRREVRTLGGKCDGWVSDWHKSALTPANDNISPAVSENAYRAAPATEDKWVPKVGDRVIDWEGDLGTVIAVNADGESDENLEVKYDNGQYPQGGTWFRFSSFNPVVAPATTVLKSGDRVRVLTDKWLLMHKNGIGAVKENLGHGVTVVVDGDDGFGWFFDYSEVEVIPPLTIESGKFYLTRDGRKVGPMERKSDWTDSQGRKGEFYTDEHGYYTANGIWLEGEVNDPEDLIAEWVEPVVHIGYDARFEIGEPVAVAEATATPKFKAGDKVRCIDVCGGSKFEVGKVYTVLGVESDLVYVDEIGLQAMYSLRFEPATPPAKFKVGDRVRVDADDPDVATVASRNSEGMMSIKWDFLSSPGDEWWSDDELIPASAEPTLTPGQTVTFTATGRLSAINENGHYQVTFKGLPSGRNSFALPADYVSLAN